MQIENAVKIALQGTLQTILAANDIGVNDALACEVRLGFQQQKITHLPLVAIDNAETDNVALGLGKALGGRQFDFAVHVWGKTEWQAQEIVGMLVEGLKLEDHNGAFAIYDYSKQDPTAKPPVLAERDDNLLGVGQPLMDQSTQAKAEDTRQFTRMVLYVPILCALVQPAVL